MAVCLFVWTDGRKFPPLFYRTSSPSGPLPKSVTWSAVPYAPLLVSGILAILLVLYLGGSGPVWDNDLWHHHKCDLLCFFPFSVSVSSFCQNKFKTQQKSMLHLNRLTFCLACRNSCIFSGITVDFHLNYFLNFPLFLPLQLSLIGNYGFHPYTGGSFLVRGGQ